jgi:hypothetical protein
MLEFIRHPWHWAFAGVMIGLTVPALLLLGNKSFGISSSLRHICAACLPANIPFFKYDWKKEIWNLVFVLGIMIGAFMANYFLSNPDLIEISKATQDDLAALGIKDFTNLMPSDIFSIQHIFSLKSLIFYVLGGFLVGFGTRYAGGCTSGHSIMGLSNLQVPSLIATISFMAGGFLMTHWLLPYLLKWIL